MKINFLCTLMLSILVFSSCNKEKKAKNIDESNIVSDGYHILGKTKGIEDSTMIYINEAGSFVDSTHIIHGEFSFSGKVDTPKQAVIQTKDYKKNGVAFIWLENQKISIETPTSSLDNAIIKGGKVQEHQTVLKKRTDSLNNILDIIEEKYRYSEVSEETRDSVINAQTAIFSEMKKIEKSFIREFPDSYVSLNLLNIYKTSWDKNIVKELYELLAKDLKSTKTGIAINDFISLPEKPKVGDSYVDFELPNTDGSLIKVSDIKAKYVLVEFWASWCGPCRKENPNLVRTYNIYKEKGFEILGVSLDSNEKHWLKAIEKDGLPWTQTSDLKAQNSLPALLYGINAIPYNFLIDEKGTIIAENLRGDDLEKQLKELLDS
ncbi:TlpA disulfide reductase family protein [uncultured Aquimarina sp.]|uniref:TlpA disulfide reductase family protein n=1 Tax=uncultured Aquimarina sp. TaxID=575652 RepID=UPI00263153DC|nr:TlpA disulfide reductase family protein [uncultured Aquimarina sp.]